MLSIDQLTILSYIADGTVLCRDCGEKAELPTSEAVCAYSTHEFAGNDGLYCDACGKEIVEPYEWTCPACDHSYYGEEAADAENEYGWGPDASHKCSDDCPGDEDEG